VIGALSGKGIVRGEGGYRRGGSRERSRNDNPDV